MLGEQELKICLIGNSYIACIKNAWDSISENYDHSISFFGSSGDTLINTKGNQNKLIPTTQQVQNSFHVTANGQKEIDFSLFDVCIVHGILPPLLYWHDLWHDLKSNIFYSQEFIHICMKNFNPIVTDSFKPTAKHLIKEIKSCTSIPIIFTIKPNPAFPEHKLIINDHEYNDLCNFLTTVFDILGIYYIPQPKDTIDNYLYTKPQFNKNALRLGSIPTLEPKFARPGDYWHLNAAYGESYLKQILKYLSSLGTNTSDRLEYQNPK